MYIIGVREAATRYLQPYSDARTTVCDSYTSRPLPPPRRRSTNYAYYIIRV